METNIAGLWLPTVIFAHVFAGIWILHTLLLSNPQALSCLWPRARRGASATVARARVLQRAAHAQARAGAAADVVLHVPRSGSHAGSANQAPGAWAAGGRAPAGARAGRGGEGAVQLGQ
jgi:hypothetical protein